MQTDEPLCASVNVIPAAASLSICGVAIFPRGVQHLHVAVAEIVGQDDDDVGHLRGRGRDREGANHNSEQGTRERIGARAFLVGVTSSCGSRTFPFRRDEFAVPGVEPLLESGDVRGLPVREVGGLRNVGAEVVQFGRVLPDLTSFSMPAADREVLTAAGARYRTAPGPRAMPSTRRGGVDLLPHLRGESKESLADRVLFWRTGGGQNFAVRSGMLKLVKVGKNPAELYDLGTDVAESTNLADKKPTDVAALQKHLDTWNGELVAPKWQSPQPAKKK